MERFDICVIGGGPSGYAAAMRALDFNKKVLLIEKNKIGGAGLYDGALSSKTLWELSKDVQLAKKRTAKFSKCTDFELDYEVIKQELNDAIAERKHLLEFHLDGLKNIGFGELFSLKKGHAKLLTVNEIEISTPTGVEIIWADNIILATGSSPRKLPDIPIDEKIIVTSDGIHGFEELPESLVVLGAGVIGCEYATIFSNFGKTKVSIIDKAARILPFEDDDVAEMVESELLKNDVIFHRNSKLERMEIKNGKVEYELSYTDGRTEVYTVEKALVAVGRVPNTYGLGLENVGIQINNRGAVIDFDTQTTVPNIYVIGDLTADIALVNVGELEGRHAVEKICGVATKPINYENISSIMFLNPLVAAVGLNETQAIEKGISYQVIRLDYKFIPRAVAMRNPPGFFKILVTNDRDLKLLGMRAVGAQASSAIQAGALLISMDKGIEELAELIHPHPSLIEGIQEACRMFLGKSIIKPSVFHNEIKYIGYMPDGHRA